MYRKLLNTYTCTCTCMYLHVLLEFIPLVTSWDGTLSVEISQYNVYIIHYNTFCVCIIHIHVYNTYTKCICIIHIHVYNTYTKCIYLSSNDRR